MAQFSRLKYLILWEKSMVGGTGIEPVASTV
jgi:hypothetical protein